MYVKRCIAQFEQTNKSKYFNDFKEFVFESSVEDFCDVSGADVVVSTIHKAKGREFDDVYMLISDNYVKDAHLTVSYTHLDDGLDSYNSGQRTFSSRCLFYCFFIYIIKHIPAI